MIELKKYPPHTHISSSPTVERFSHHRYLPVMKYWVAVKELNKVS